MCQSEARNTKVLLAANTSDVQWEIHLYIGCQKSDETGGRESKGRSGLMKLSKLFQNGKIWRSWMTDSNSVELFHVEFFLTENQTSKVEISLFKGFVPPTHFQKQVGWGTWLVAATTPNAPLSPGLLVPVGVGVGLWTEGVVGFQRLHRVQHCLQALAWARQTTVKCERDQNKDIVFW